MEDRGSGRGQRRSHLSPCFGYAFRPQAMNVKPNTHGASPPAEPRLPYSARRPSIGAQTPCAPLLSLCLLLPGLPVPVILSTFAIPTGAFVQVARGPWGASGSLTA